MNDNTIESTAIVVREDPAAAPPALFGSDDPAQALERAVSVANVLKKLIVAQGYAKQLGRPRPGEKPREFVEVAGWQALGGFLDTFAKVEWSKPIERGFESRVILVRRGQEVGAGEAICTRDERNWKDRDDFAIKSMSQTRAAGKAFRLTFGWLMTIAGYESCPVEEMPAEEPKPAPPQDDSADRDRGRKAVAALCRENSISDKDRHAESLAMFGRESMSDLTYPELRSLYSRLKAIAASEKLGE